MYLTKRQKEILDLVAAHVAERGYAPTLEEIGAYFGLRSPATVYKHVQKLVQKGYLRKAPHQGRGLQLVSARDNPSLEVAVLAQISGGEPLTPMRPADTVMVPATLQTGGQLFALRARGDSLSADHIIDGDLLVVEERTAVRDGDVVVALRPDRAAGLLRAARTPDGLRFGPTRGPAEAAALAPGDVEVRGILVAVMRRYDRSTPSRAR